MKNEKCGDCNGKGQVAIDHHAWLSGGKFYEKDVMGECESCNGTGEHLEPEEFSKSDYCQECGGVGFLETTSTTPNGSKVKFNEQCEECVNLNKAEARIDRLYDELKGN